MTQNVIQSTVRLADAKCSFCGIKLCHGFGVYLNKPTCAGCQELLERASGGRPELVRVSAR
jgi:hypothetical protein